MYLHTTRTFCGLSPNALASAPLHPSTNWLASQTVSVSSPASFLPHLATVACGSIGLWCSIGVRKVMSFFTADASKAAKASPFSNGFSRLATLSGVSVSESASKRSVRPVDSSYLAVTACAPAVAASIVRPKTTAIHWLSWWISGDWSGITLVAAAPPLESVPTSFISGQVTCVIALKTPAVASAAATSTSISRPLAIVLCTPTP